MRMKRFKIKRKSERWVSNNRVLIGSSKKDPGRNPNFDTEETKLLISLWGDPKVQRTLITTHRKHTVIAKLAEKMGEYGYTRSADEINTRIKNLKCFYNRLKRDMEMGVISGASWKHFNAMDEIMTRSIFSVRPNEIPKPSLKYQLEVEQHEREERNKLRIAKAKLDKMNTSDTQTCQESVNQSGDDCFNQEAAMLDDSIVQINCDELMKYVENEDNYVKIKEEKCLDSDEDKSLLIPKNEPIEGDEEFQNSNSEANKNTEEQPPRVGDLIQISSSSPVTTTTSPVCRMPAANGSITTTTTTTTNISPAIKPNITPSILFANQAKPMPPTGKISLVPTNFLLQQNAPPTPQIKIRPQHQQRIICSQPNPQPNIATSGPSRMKVLLVNTFQNGKTPNNAVTKEPVFTNPNLLTTTTSLLKTNAPDVGSTMKSNVEPPKQTKPDETPSSKDPVIEMLFNKLIVMQNENNDIQRQRLEIERQRFEFEKSIAEKLLAAFTSSNPMPCQDYASFSRTADRSGSIEIFSNEKTRTINIADDFNGFQLITPKIERED